MFPPDVPCAHPAPLPVPGVAPLTEKQRLERALAAVDAHLEKITAPGVEHDSADVARCLANRARIKAELAELAGLAAL